MQTFQEVRGKYHKLSQIYKMNESAKYLKIN